MESFNTKRFRFRVKKVILIKKVIVIISLNRMTMKKIMKQVLLNRKETRKWDGRFLNRNYWRLRTLKWSLVTLDYVKYITIEIGGSTTILITIWSSLIQALKLLNLVNKFTIATENALIVISCLSKLFVFNLMYSYGFSLGANDNPYDSVEIKLAPSTLKCDPSEIENLLLLISDDDPFIIRLKLNCIC